MIGAARMSKACLKIAALAEAARAGASQLRKSQHTTLAHTCPTGPDQTEPLGSHVAHGLRQPRRFHFIMAVSNYAVAGGIGGVSNTIGSQAGQMQRLELTNASYASVTVARASDAQEGAIHNMIMDTDKDGKVSAEERSAHASEVAAHRDLIDRDHDGKVSFEEELRYGLDHQLVTRTEISKLLAIDTNKDGVKSPQEQIAYLVKQMSKAAAK